MYCKYCGKEIDDNAYSCIYCRRATDRGLRYAAQTSAPQTSSVGNSKTAIGIILELFLGILGLIIGLLLYKDGTTERSTFLKGWLIGLAVSIVLGLIIYGIYMAVLVNMATSAY